MILLINLNQIVISLKHSDIVNKLESDSDIENKFETNTDTVDKFETDSDM